MMKTVSGILMIFAGFAIAVFLDWMITTDKATNHEYSYLYWTIFLAGAGLLIVGCFIAVKPINTSKTDNTSSLAKKQEVVDALGDSMGVPKAPHQR